jgi:hypothetical protein
MKAMTREQFISHWLARGEDGEPSLLEQLCEHVGEADTQFRSECALFGDAGPGQGYRLNRSKAELAKVLARLRAFGCNV